LQIAFDTATLRSLSLDNALNEISAAGYHYIETGLAHFVATGVTGKEIQHFREILSKNDLELAAICGNYALSHPNEDVRKFAVQQFKKALTATKELGCNRFVSELNGDPDHGKESEIAFLRSIEEILPTLESNGIRLCFEAHPGDFIESNNRAVDLIKKVNSKQLGYLYCVPHSFVLGDDVREMIGYSRDVLDYVHLADSLRPETTYFSGRYTPKVRPHQHLVPGLGDVDLHELVTSLQEIGYEGFVTFNPFSHFDHPIEALKLSKQKAEELFNRPA
jgi:myo-inositol catabolism protein IolH